MPDRELSESLRRVKVEPSTEPGAAARRVWAVVGQDVAVEFVAREHQPGIHTARQLTYHSLTSRSSREEIWLCWWLNDPPTISRPHDCFHVDWMPALGAEALRAWAATAGDDDVIYAWLENLYDSAAAADAAALTCPPRPTWGYPDEFFESWATAADFITYFAAWPGDPHGDFASFVDRKGAPATGQARVITGGLNRVP